MPQARTVFESPHAGGHLSDEAKRALAIAYAEPHRKYHTARHVAHVVGWYDWVAETVGWKNPWDVFVAAVFHDAVYDPKGRVNEERSVYAARTFAGASDRACELILLTARHGSLKPGDVDVEAARFLDCDMAILGADEDEFDAYDAGVAAEYACVPPAAFREGRFRFLMSLLVKPRIFLSDEFHAKLDVQARFNVMHAAAKLRPGGEIW